MKSLLSFILFYSVFAVPVNASTESAPHHVQSIKELYIIALEKDPELSLAKAREDKSEYGVDLSYSQLLPQVNLNSSLNQIRYSSDITSYDYQGERHSITLNQTIYDRSIYSSIDQAEHENEYQIAQSNFTQQERTSIFLERLIEILIKEDELKSRQAELKLLQKNVERAQSLYSKKLISNVDRSSAYAQLDKVKSEISQVEADLIVAREVLSESIGAAAFGPLPSISDFDSIPTLQNTYYEYWKDIAINNSPLMRAKQAQIKRAEAALDKVKGEHFPKLGLQINHQQTNIGSEFAQTNDNQATVVSINLSIPIYSGGSTTAKTHAQEVEKVIAEEELRLTRMQLLKELRLSFVTIQALSKSKEAAEVALKSSITARKAAEKSFQFGIVDIVQMLEKINQEYTSLRTLSDINYRLVQNYIRLMKWSGKLDENLIDELNDIF